MASYWQIGAGSGDRDYSEECINLGMAFVGEEYWKTIKQVEENDITILRKGRTNIIAVGRLVKHPAEDKHVVMA